MQQGKLLIVGEMIRQAAKVSRLRRLCKQKQCLLSVNDGELSKARTDTQRQLGLCVTVGGDVFLPVSSYVPSIIRLNFQPLPLRFGLAPRTFSTHSPAPAEPDFLRRHESEGRNR